MKDLITFAIKSFLFPVLHAILIGYGSLLINHWSYFCFQSHWRVLNSKATTFELNWRASSILRSIYRQWVTICTNIPNRLLNCNVQLNEYFHEVSRSHSVCNCNITYSTYNIYILWSNQDLIMPNNNIIDIVMHTFVKFNGDFAFQCKALPTI